MRLPVHVPSGVLLRPESVFGRAGLTRGGQQLESSEFNRRFRVDAGNPTLTVHLLDVTVQEVLARDFDGRSVELQGDLLVVAGRPTERDPGLTGFVGELPGLRRDSQRLVEAVQPAFWRAVSLPKPGD